MMIKAMKSQTTAMPTIDANSLLAMTRLHAFICVVAAFGSVAYGKNDGNSPTRTIAIFDDKLKHGSNFHVVA